MANVSIVGVTSNPGIVGVGRLVFAASMVGLGIIGLFSGDFASVWQRIPIENLPGRVVFAYLCAAVELAVGVGLLVPRTAKVASTVLVIFLLLWAVLLKLPAIVAMPQMEATWLGLAEISVMLAGAWTLFAGYASSPTFAVGPAGIRWARLLLAVSLPVVGLSHFIYSKETAGFVPPWLPSPIFWAYLTGAGNIAAGIALLLGIVPRLAATLEAAMMVVITVLVWTPGLSPAPTNQFQLTGFMISTAIAAGVWIVADSYRGVPWLAMGWPLSRRSALASG